ncbi:MAG: phosphomannomutase/phosphoglucomutase [bacterium]
MVNPLMFREYDIRGIINDDLTIEVAEQIGKGFGTYIEGKNIIVGRDNRLSSKDLAGGIIKGLLSTGCNVIDIGLCPTPVLYFAVLHLNGDGGIMVTASHNPPEFNGFKLRKTSSAIFGEQVQVIREIIESNKFKTGEGKLEEKNILDDYLKTIKERIKLKRKLKIVVDAGNGTVGPIATKLLKELGCEVIELYCTPDGNFPNHLPDPTVTEYMQDLSKKVISEKAEVGIGYDGDGDRIGIVDNQGSIVWGDKLLILYFREMVRKRTLQEIPPDKKISVVFDVKCSQSLIDEIKKYGETPIMGKTGYPNIQSKMKENDALLAGEMSGHMYFRDNYLGFDDAIFASCRLLELLSNTDKSVCELLSDILQYHSTPEIRIDCPDTKKFEIVNEVKNYFKQQYETIDIDGIRILFGDGFALIRASNTQPILVLRFEAKTKERLKEITKIVVDKLKEFLPLEIEV